MKLCLMDLFVDQPPKLETLYDGLHAVRGTWHERLGQVVGLAAVCCGAAFVSVHLYCPYQSCFVVMSSRGPLAEVLQTGDIHLADTSAGPASLQTSRLARLGSGGGVAGHGGFFGASSASYASCLSSPGEPTSLQLLLRGKVTICRSPPAAAVRVTGNGSSAAAAAAEVQLPPDWRQLYHNAQLSDFTAVPILDGNGALVAAVTVAGPASAASAVGAAADGGGGAGAGTPRLADQVHQFERFARVLGLAFFSDPKQLSSCMLAASTLAAVQRAETLQALVEASHEGFGALLERHFRLEGARCVLALSDSMEARVAYFGPPPPPAGVGVVGGAGGQGGPAVAAVSAAGTAGVISPSAVIGGGGGGGGGVIVAGGSAVAVGAALLMSRSPASSQQGPGVSGAFVQSMSVGTSAPLQGVLGPLMDTLLLDVVSREGPGNGRVVANCRAYLQQEDKPGRDVQVCFQLCRMPPACLALAVVGAAESTLAPEIALYVCTAQQQVPAGLLEEVRAEAQCMLQLLMPHIHRQLLGPLAAEWSGMRLQAAAGCAMAAGGGGASGGGGGGGVVLESGSASVNSVLTGLSGGVSLGGLCRTVSFSVDDLVSQSPAHLKTVVAGIQSTITAAQVHNYFFDVLVVGYAQDEGSSLPGRQLPDAAAAAGGGGGGGAANGTPPSTLSTGPTNLVIVMEYCDAGTLKDSMYICLLEVALALRHMHSLALVHCDLKPSNVLLKSQPRDPRGWTCKAPGAEDGGGPGYPYFTVTRALGTLTHMAPEVISKGALLTSSVDVYSFGILMAELATGLPQDQCMQGKEAIQLARKGLVNVLQLLLSQDAGASPGDGAAAAAAAHASNGIMVTPPPLPAPAVASLAGPVSAVVPLPALPEASAPPPPPPPPPASAIMAAPVANADVPVVNGGPSPSASSLSSSAHQLTAQLNPPPAGQQAVTSRYAAGATPAPGNGGDGIGGGGVAGIAAPVVLPGSPIIIPKTGSGQAPSPVRSEYDSPGEHHHFSGSCSDTAAVAERLTSVGGSSGGAAAAAAATTAAAAARSPHPGAVEEKGEEGEREGEGEEEGEEKEKEERMYLRELRRRVRRCLSLLLFCEGERAGWGLELRAANGTVSVAGGGADE
ncbi:hypothetical protein VOLCADRAFT_94257 [Volvox carteri f. nagariensis]|uniref:Protein kinase domain-containing protein n=1 Tax=Volvox carteri f. nagariensis TaxID=3068 RepID=D8U412_VOLCA|nr:uncharacterized protein VOLCADRAFT_94257 [Volvox carteri f. nagariensis]EFJ45516.1 hypothetical protein VOLCADRAFT_94257 [Volvox carteri f. nagariensis]|eukprot:XP_002953543.1 hypothetical protein VOLCADRAFT_94257 [Volvox carteri f. nagariensis]